MRVYGKIWAWYLIMLRWDIMRNIVKWRSTLVKLSVGSRKNWPFRIEAIYSDIHKNGTISDPTREKNPQLSIWHTIYGKNHAPVCIDCAMWDFYQKLCAKVNEYIILNENGILSPFGILFFFCFLAPSFPARTTKSGRLHEPHHACSILHK